jgi:hypothetical protein
MKITLIPRRGQATFTPADLVEQLNRWVLPGSRGQVTARCTLSRKLQALTLDVEGEATATPSLGETSP